MPDRPRILATRRLPPLVEAALREHFDVQAATSNEALGALGLQRALGAADGVICTVSDRLTAAVLSTKPRRARILANYGVGVDHIDLDAAQAYGMTVTNTPGVLTDDTADLAMTLLLATLRRVGEGEREVRGGRWSGWHPTHLLGRRVTGLTLGIIGLGRIGLATARRAARGFDMQVIGTSRTRPSDDLLAAHGVAWRDRIEDVLMAADAISLHVPGGADTAGMIDARRIALMPPGAVLINTARGAVVDDDALIAALVSGHLGGAGLDVYADEPHVDPRLLGHERVVLLPHLGSATREGRHAMGMRVMASLRAFFAGESVPDVVV